MENASSSKSLRILLFCIGMLFAMPVLPSNVKSVAIGLFLAATLFYIIANKVSFNKWFFITNGGLFVLIALTYLYSEDSAYALRKLSTMLSLFVFPLAFSFISKKDIDAIFKHRNQFLLVYLIAVFALNVVPFIWFYATHYSFNDMLVHFPTVMRVDTGKWSIHPIYLSMHCSIAILFGFYILRGTLSKIKIALVLAMMLILFLFLFLYAKKGPMLALVAVFTLFILFQKRSKLIRVYVFAIIGFIALTLLIPRTREKFMEMQHIEVLKEGKVTSTNIRYTIYNVAQELIGESLITGYGVGDYNNKLDEKYKSLGDDILVRGSFNSHNQYFSLLLIGGIVVLVAFLIMMGLNLVFAIRFNNQLLILVLIFYGIAMLTENILEREGGVIFFGLFLNFFASKSLYAQEE
jgi:O-antigen ligase